MANRTRVAPADVHLILAVDRERSLGAAADRTQAAEAPRRPVAAG
jgi:hypothetical protein